MAPKRLVAGEGLDEVSAQLHLLVEELKERGGAELPAVLTRLLPVSLVVVRGTDAGDCAAHVLEYTGGGGGGGGGSCSLRELGDQLLEEVLTVVEAAVVRHVHGHPEAGGGQLIVEHLRGKVAVCKGAAGRRRDICRWRFFGRGKHQVHVMDCVQ